jgi:multiple sugar transport system permease protein
MANPLRKRTVLDLSPRAKVVAYTIMIAWAIVVLFPLYWLVLTSFKQPIQFTGGTYYIPFVDFQPTLDNWKYILVDVGSDTYRPYVNTIVVGITSASIALVLGSLAAYGLVRYRYRPRVGVIALGLGCTVLAMIAVILGTPPIVAVASAIAVLVLLIRAVGKRLSRTRLGNRDISFWLISQRMMPPVAVVIPIYVLFQQLHLLDTQIALIVTYAATNLPIVVWLMTDYFSAIPLELEESASVDGASPYRTFRSIVLPVAAPGLVATFILVLVFAWNEYLIALFLATANAATMPLLVAGQVATRGPQYWYMSVLIVIMVVPVIVMSVILERFISRGILAGAVKG